MNAEPQPDSPTTAATRACVGSHNTAVDEGRRAAGACAQVHLPTGRMCALRQRHAGSCEFIAAGEVDESIARRRAAESW